MNLCVCVCFLLKAHVRVLCEEGEDSDWSESFSLDTVGSEGVLSCQCKDQQLQVNQLPLPLSLPPSIILHINFVSLYSPLTQTVSTCEYNYDASSKQTSTGP